MKRFAKSLYNIGMTSNTNPQQQPTASSPLPAVGAIIMQEQAGSMHYLLIQRAKEPYIGRWALIGGKWDYGETLPEAICREVKEETSLNTTFAGVHAVISERLISPADSGVIAHYLILLCALTVTDGDAQEQQEGAVAWFTQQELDALSDADLIVPSDYLMLRDFAAATAVAPYVDIKVRTTLEGVGGNPVEMLQYEHHS